MNKIKLNFKIANYSYEVGREFVTGKIAKLKIFPSNLPGIGDEIKNLELHLDKSIFVEFGDNDESIASCCLIPENAIFFGGSEHVDGKSKSAVIKLSKIIRYKVHKS